MKSLVFRYSLRTLLLAVVGAALICWPAARIANVGRRERASLKLLRGSATVHVAVDSGWPKRVVKLSLQGGRLSGEQLTQLCSFTHLRDLELRSVQVKDEDLIHLRQCTSLKSLSLCGSSITDEGLRLLGGILHVRSLDLSRTPITDACAATLRKFIELESLDLSFTCITDSFADDIVKMGHLRVLSLNCTNVSDKTLRRIAEHPNLVRINVEYTNVTVDAVRRLSAQPGIEIGHCVKPFVGMQLRDGVNGVQIASITPASPAENVGLAPGDYIVAVDRVAVTTRAEFYKVFEKCRPGDVVHFSVVRGGSATSFHLVLGDLGSDYLRAVRRGSRP